MNRRRFYLAQLSRVLWLRATLYAAGAVAMALAAHALEPLVPERLVGLIGEESAEEILTIIASSMLAVTTFSLATMVAAASAVTANASPRAAALMLEEKSAQNALSSFIGAFIFSVVGLIALGTDYYAAAGRFVVFLATLAVLALVIVRLLSWIDELSRLGRVGEAIDRVEKATRKALQHRRAFLGGVPQGDAPDGAQAVCSPAVGYVQHVDVGHLDRVAREHGLTVHLCVLPGAFVRLSRPMLLVAGGSADDGVQKALRAGVVLGDRRTFQQDPRFGLVVLAEIASRALSPAVNDPGTAIDVVGTAVRLLSVWAEDHWEEEPERRFRNVRVPGLSAADFFDDVFSPIERDGADKVEVGVALQKAFCDLARATVTGFADAARAHSDRALRLAERALPDEADVEQLRSLAAEVR